MEKKNNSKSNYAVIKDIVKKLSIILVMDLTISCTKLYAYIVGAIASRNVFASNSTKELCGIKNCIVSYSSTFFGKEKKCSYQRIYTGLPGSYKQIFKNRLQTRNLCLEHVS